MVREGGAREECFGLCAVAMDTFVVLVDQFSRARLPQPHLDGGGEDLAKDTNEGTMGTPSGGGLTYPIVPCGMAPRHRYGDENKKPRECQQHSCSIEHQKHGDGRLPDRQIRSPRVLITVI